ncbi:secreted RxLR effector protein 161-like [Prosopis cineraria]|uniref:secreted RxLR effector protein 161-like n=1 Tax=Prosopis cineraria TaxID=364024 RepID=UPI00241021D8|nr:secreted RxLR effector protein 161-like [Prosopis cineraria]
MDTPVASGMKLSPDMGPKTEMAKRKMERVPYVSAVKSLMYAMICTRPDICYVVGLVSRYQSNPREGHWKAVKRILRYLKGTVDYALCYQGSDLRLTGYSDADLGRDEDERRSTSSYTFLLNNGAICWSSKKQTCIALHSMEAKFVACTAVVQEAMWLKRFIEHLGFGNESINLVLIHCDNTAAITYTKDPKYHSKTKHVDIKYNFVRDYIAQKVITVQYISMKCMIADPLTKPIAKEIFEKHVRALGMARLT